MPHHELVLATPVSMSKLMPKFDKCLYADWVETATDNTVCHYELLDTEQLRTLWNYPRTTDHKFLGMTRDKTGSLVLNYGMKFGNSIVRVAVTLQD